MKGPDVHVRTAAVFRAPRVVALTELSFPPLADDEVLIGMEACALCTMEKQIYTGELPFYPVVPGHEVCGTVVDAGSTAGAHLVGSRVAADLLTRCGRCRSCRAGMSCVCSAPQGNEFDGNVKGMGAGLSHALVCKVSGCYVAPPDAPAELVALAEPLACVLHAVRRSGFRPGERCAVIGAGFMGRLHQLVLQRLCASAVDCVEPDQARAAAFLEVGGAHLDDQGALDQAARGTYERVFVTYLGEGALESALELSADGGTVVLFGGVEGMSPTTMDPYILHRRAISLVGAYSQEPRDWFAAMGLLANVEARQRLRLLVTHEFGLADIDDALTAALDRSSLRVVVRP
jgi:L-iditol 2-dehydrogenase